VIPRTLAMNAGAKPVRLLTELRAKHAQDPVKNVNWGVDGNTGELVDMLDAGIWDAFAVKAQTLKTAVESSVLLIRVDGIVSGLSAPSQQQ
jgi:T-complex protein 1 subunit gamma